MTNHLAQVSHPLATPISGVGPLGQGGSGSITMLARVLSTTIGLLTVLGVLYFVFILITGAIALINSGGDKGSIETARKKIGTGAIGVVVLIAAIFVMDLIANILDIPNILNLSAMLDLIRL